MFAYLARQSITVKAILLVVVIAVLFGSGFVVATWRANSRIADADRREQEARVKIAANDAESNKLRGVNDQLRKHVAELSAQDEGLKAIIESRGGQIAAEAKNLDKINADLKTNLAVVSAPGDKCVRCRAYSDELLRAKQIGRPLTCKDECNAN